MITPLMNFIVYLNRELNDIYFIPIFKQAKSIELDIKEYFSNNLNLDTGFYEISFDHNLTDIINPILRNVSEYDENKAIVLIEISNSLEENIEDLKEILTTKQIIWLVENFKNIGNKSQIGIEINLDDNVESLILDNLIGIRRDKSSVHYEIAYQ